MKTCHAPKMLGVGTSLGEIFPKIVKFIFKLLQLDGKSFEYNRSSIKLV